MPAVSLRDLPPLHDAATRPLRLAILYLLKIMALH